MLPYEVSTEVGGPHRWPYKDSHPMAWGSPWKGILLAENDPLAWRSTLAFPSREPTQEEVDKHLAALRDRGIPLTAVPVAWKFRSESDDIRDWIVHWEDPDQIVPYRQTMYHWTVEREVVRGAWCPKFRVHEHFNGFSVEHVATGETHWLGDGVDTLSTDGGQSWKPGTPGFRQAWEYVLNTDPATYEAYFPDIKHEE